MTPASPEELKRSLCAAAYHHPDTLTDALTHGITAPFTIQPHRHHDLLQLDVIDGCEGQAVQDESVTTIHGLTLLTALPGCRHGYTLRPGRPPSRVWLIKLRVPAAWRTLPAPPWPTLLTRLPAQDAITAAIDRLVDTRNPQKISLNNLLDLATLLTRWPTTPDAPPEPSWPTDDATPSRISLAVERLARRVHQPPSLDELAHAAGLSPRHFARCFQALYHVTPHQFVAARRLDAARELLLKSTRRIRDVADELGFDTPAAFSRWFTRLAGQSPRQFREDPHYF